MTRRGPKTKPTPQNQPGPLPPPPDWLEGERALRFWDEFAAPLNSLGLLESLDVIAFGMLCDAFESYVVARDQLQLDELVVHVGDQGHPTQNPLVAIVRQQTKAIREILSEFGMTPSSRTQLTGSTSATRKAVELDPLEALASRFNEAVPPVKRTPRKRKPTTPARRKKAATKRAAKKKAVAKTQKA